MDMMASVYLAASYEGKDIQETSRFVEDTLIPYLERQEGVTSISDIGIVENSISVDLNQDKIDVKKSWQRPMMLLRMRWIS